MEKEEIVQLLQYRRHDLVNDIQVIHGYASMQMFDKVQEKLADFLHATEHERKLHMIKAAHFILWIEMFRMKHKNFKLTYEIAEFVDIRAHDEWLTNICEKLMKEMNQHVTNENIHDVHIYLYNNVDEQAFIQIRVNQVDDYLCERLLSIVKQLKDSVFTFSDAENRLTCDFQIDGTIEG